MATDTLVSEIDEALAAEAGGRDPGTGSSFNKPGDEWVSYGLKVPAFRGVMRVFRSRIMRLPLASRVHLAERLLAMHIGEAGHAGIAVLHLSANELAPQHFSTLDRMLDDFRGWSHVDDFCGTAMRTLLDRYPDETVHLLDGWTRSPNCWKRRTSVVAFTRKVGESGRFTDAVLQFCERLARDPEDLVQKGVGWALKDNMRGSPERVLAFVKELRLKGVSSVVTLYAIRDLKGARRDEVLALKARG